MSDTLSKHAAKDWKPGELGPQLGQRLRNLTPARIALERAGISTTTAEVLDFQLAHARARDAVQAALQPAGLLVELRRLTASMSEDPILLHSAALDRRQYLQRPDLGRQLGQPSRDRLTTLRHAGSDRNFDLAIVVADGLSALAIERHALPLLGELFPLLAASPTIRLAPICVVEQARVAIADEIAQLLRAEMVIVLIGERPGLSSPDSLGAYISWEPRPGTTDAERNCISNIRPEGLGYTEAARRLLHYIREACRLKQTGVALKDPEIQGTTLKSDFRSTTLLSKPDEDARV